MVGFWWFFVNPEVFCFHKLLFFKVRKRGREVEGTPLLREHAGKTCIEGSNPSVSAKKFRKALVRKGFFVFWPAGVAAGPGSCPRGKENLSFPRRGLRRAAHCPVFVESPVRRSAAVASPARTLLPKAPQAWPAIPSVRRLGNPAFHLDRRFHYR